MRTNGLISTVGCVSAAFIVALAGGCKGVEGANDGYLDSCDVTYTTTGGFEGVDMLVVVDNSISMGEEQAILATSFFSLINALVNPPPGWSIASVDDLRVAIVTSDMGLSWGGNPYKEGDGWPGTNPCSALGDNGAFQTYGAGTTAFITEGVIECGSDAAQCPIGWVCEDIDEETGRGVCNDPAGDGAGQVCPSLAATWAGTDPGLVNHELAFQVSCLAAQGTTGCGFEQQLQSAARALTRTDQADFVRDDALLVILVVSDEDDCSMEDGPGLFATDEIQGTIDGPSAINIACGENPMYLYDADHFSTVFASGKTRANSVIFAAIVGVPRDDACQGTGDEIGGCNEHADMERKVMVETGSDGQPMLFYFPACTREEEMVQVTKALPGRRYIELATTKYGPMSYIYSICNEDWSPAMNEISALIASNLAVECMAEGLPWDPGTKTSACKVAMDLVNPESESCPFEFGDVDPVVEREVVDGVEAVHVYCEFPKLSAELDCAENDESEMAGGFGWRYCENLATEDFADACTDTLDNDGDGMTDCGDEECQACSVCDGAVVCDDRCKYMIELTDSAIDAVDRRTILVACPK